MRGPAVDVMACWVLACSSPSSAPSPEPPPTKPTTPMRVASETPERCAIRVSDRGIAVDGEQVTRDRAVTLCKARSTALVELADGASESEWNELRAALVAAGVPILMRGRRDDGPECEYNPLARGCM